MSPKTDSLAGVLGASDRDLEPGDVVGEYVIDKKIGQGGFGTVYRAEHPVIGKKVAIKVLRRKYSSDPEYVSRFVDEARSVNQIRHRNIIDIFAFAHLSDGRHYFVMEFLEGHTLEEHRRARGRIPVGEAVALLRGLAKALDAAHRKGIAHRDLKPDNVFLVEEEGQPLFPKLLDFGIAKLLSDDDPKHRTRTGTPLGTPVYMSPEQARGREIDHRTDIYSFGIMLYELMTGELPFVGDDYVDILSDHLKTKPEPPSSRCEELPPEVDIPIMWMLEKHPDKRPPTISTALKALERAAIDAGVTVPSTPPQSGVFAAGTGAVSDEVGIASTRAAFDGAAATIPDVEAQGKRVVKEATRSWLPLVLVALVLVGVAALLVRTRSPSNRRKSSSPPSPLSTAVNDRISPPTKVVADPQNVDIEITGAPKGSSVYGPSGKFFGTAPGRIQVARSDESLVLQIRARGYASVSREVIPSHDVQVSVVLERLEMKSTTATHKPKEQPKKLQPKPPENTRGTLEDPFK